MSNIDEVEARLVTEVLGGDWDFTVPDPHTLEFLNPQVCVLFALADTHSGRIQAGLDRFSTHPDVSAGF